MPRRKLDHGSSPLTLGELDRLEAAIGNLFARVRSALDGGASESHALVERLERAGFFAPAGGNGGGGRRAQAGAAPKQARRRRRRHEPIDTGKVIAALKKAGGDGQTSGQLATALKIPTERLRFELYKLRDAGQIRMTGKMSQARYFAGDAK